MVCMNCGAQFTPSKNDRRIKFCSVSCRLESRAKNGYMKSYYVQNNSAWESRQRTEKYKSEKNEARRKRYSEDANYREIAKKKVRIYNETHTAVRMNQRMKKFGITYDDYKRMHEQQNGKCAICGSDIGDVMGNRLYVDHDHQSGKVRGLLCSSCNFGIGKFLDSPILLRKAAEYLEG